MPPLFNIREWPLFRVARNVLGSSEDEAPLRSEHRAQPPLGMTSLDDRQAAESAREHEIELANNASQQQREEELVYFSDSKSSAWDDDLEQSENDFAENDYGFGR